MEAIPPKATPPYHKHPGINYKHIILDRLKLCLLILFIYLILNLFHIGCPIKGLYGISCPGCGMTRAVIAALHFHFPEAFHYHPLFFLTPILFLLFVFEPAIPRSYRGILWFVIIFLFITVYLYRLILLKDPIVTIDFESGLIKKFLNLLI